MTAPGTDAQEASPVNDMPLSPSEHDPGFLKTLLRRLVWLDVPSERGSSDGVILVSALAALGIWLAADRYDAGANANFYPGGVTDLAWYGMGALALAWVARRAASGLTRLRPVVAGVAAALPVVVALSVAVGFAPAWAQLPGYAFVAILAAVQLRRILSRLGATQVRRALLASALFCLVFRSVSSAAHVYPNLWWEADEEDEGALSWSDSEDVLFDQPDKIDAAGASLAPGRPGQPDVFFVGFAGDGDEKVFAEELKLSQSIVEHRYGAEGRSLLLVNDRRDHETWPIASVRGLRRALVRVGERMEREDVLFLMLTSHGSDDHELSVSNGSLPLSELDGASLRAALDEAKIRYRVIVISACYSGGFLKPLQDDGTIVLTSASATRTSFGCSDLTYFGEAFLRDALPRADSLRAAFEQAKLAIEEREKRETITPSDPQIHVGRAIERHWERIEAGAVKTRPAATAGEESPDLPR